MLYKYYLCFRIHTIHFNIYLYEYMTLILYSALDKTTVTNQLGLSVTTIDVDEHRIIQRES